MVETSPHLPQSEILLLISTLHLLKRKTRLRNPMEDNSKSNEYRILTFLTTSSLKEKSKIGSINEKKFHIG